MTVVLRLLIYMLCYIVGAVMQYSLPYFGPHHLHPAGEYACIQITLVSLAWTLDIACSPATECKIE